MTTHSSLESSARVGSAYWLAFILGSDCTHPLAFGVSIPVTLVGVLASLTTAVAHVVVGVFAYFDADCLLVKAGEMTKAVAVRQLFEEYAASQVCPGLALRWYS